jgi:hypothetical protein
MPRRRRSVSPSPPPRRFAPALRHRPQRLTIHQFLRRLDDQRQHSTRLIVIFGPFHRIELSLSRRPDVLVVATLEDCLGLQDLFWREHNQHIAERCRTTFPSAQWMWVRQDEP